MDSHTQHLIDISQTQEQKDFIENWNNVYTTIKKYENIWMRKSGSKSRRILDLIFNFNVKFCILVDFHLKEYKEIPWKTYVTVCIYQKKLSIDELKAVVKEFDNHADKLLVANSFKKMIALLKEENNNEN
jgi:hypothetical protein